jgi:serine/threonine protein kinase
MTPEHWQQINDLYHASLEREPAARNAFVAQACGDDNELRREVESLIASHEQAENFIEQPVFDAVARLLTAERPELLAGRHIGHYEILAELGTGGMGEVYLAQDTNLGRQVAIKLLRDRFTSEKDRVRRFQQEARSASALNVPNIVTIHEIGEVENRHYIATEFIDGQTLREIIANGPMAFAEALDVAIQVTKALAAAHESGIIHRDIKPENIMVRRRDHLVKVLDFGLAKLMDEPLEEAATQPDPTGLLETDPNTVMGTVSYMSPEQARQLPVDKRTDVFSLGVVIYELIGGLRPFRASTRADLLTSILEQNPAPLSAHRADVPRELERIVTKALQKDAADRYQTIQEMSADLRRLSQQLRNQAGLSEEVELVFKRAIELNPNYAPAHESYAYFLSTLRRHEEALFEIKRAQDLDPLSVIISTDVGWMLGAAQQYDEGIKQLLKTVEMDPTFMRAHQYLVIFYEHEGKFEEAITEDCRVSELKGVDSEKIASFEARLKEAYQSQGGRGYWQKRLEFAMAERSKRQYQSPIYIAVLYGQLGDNDKAFEWLEKAYKDRSASIFSIKVNPRFIPLRSDPRFASLLIRMGLTP